MKFFNKMMKQKIKLLTILLILFFFQEAKAQISVSFSKTPLSQALLILEKASGYSFFYSSALTGLDTLVGIEAENQDMASILNNLLYGLEISYEIKSDKQIILSKKEKRPVPQETNPNKLIITGTVKDLTGLPLINCGVLIEGGGTGTVTDGEGRFSIELPHSGAVLVFTSLGYETIRFKTGKERTVNIVLKEDKELLEEVVVIGYGTQKKVNLTGAVSMISGDDMASRPINNALNGLQGLLPGVTVVNPSAQPGMSRSTIRIRGIGTIGKADPLILIDGVEGDLISINPEDIESVSVLKDAASAAIYGARAANGVILVSTKKLSSAKAVEASVSLGSYFGFQTPTRLPEMCGAIDFMSLDNEARQNVGTPAAWSESDFEKVRTGSDPNHFADTEWLKAVLNTYAPQQNYTLGINGKIGGGGYLLSYRHFNQEGLTSGASTGERKHNLRFKINTRLIDRLDLSSNISYTSGRVISPVNSLKDGGGAIYNAMRIAPNSPIYYTDGSWAYGGGTTNPAAILHNGGRTKIETEELSIMETLKLDICKGLNVSATYNLTSYNGLKDILKKTITFTNPQDGSQYVYAKPNSLKNEDLRHIQNTFIIQSNFDFSFHGHNIGGVIGMSQEWYKSRSFSASRTSLISEKNPSLNLGSAASMSNDAKISSWAIRSGFGRLSYNFKERYLLEANLRYDLSSRFSKKRRGGLFPSFSAGWRISEENFMSFSKKIFDNIKLRASWGMLGNQYVGSSDFPYMSILKEFSSGISLIGSNPTTGYVQTNLSNPNLTWEKIKMLDLGLDLSLLQNRLSVSFDWYDKNTEGILLRLNYPGQLGAYPSEQNAGKVNNRGWELDINWRDRRGGFDYGAGFNISDVKNKIIDLGGNPPDLSGYKIRQAGYPIDAFYGYIAEGLMGPDDFKISDKENHIYNLPSIPVIIGNSYQPGDIKYKDISGPDGKPDGRITPEYDKVVIGSNIPRYTYSLRMHAGWKGIDFSMALQGVGKCTGYLTGTARHAFQDMAAYPQKIHLERYNIKSNPNPSALYPRLTYNTSFNQSTFSTFWLENAAYLRVKNIQIGYSLPDIWISKIRMSKCRIYFSADNIFTFSKFFYAYDPETPVSSGGYYPQVKTFAIGMNIIFK